MTNSTDVYWEANGYSLSTEAWAVSTWGGRRQTPAIKRGEDLLLPFRTGRRYRAKLRESRVLTLHMWMLPIRPDGTPHPTLSPFQMREVNWRALLEAIDIDEQFDLVKRFYDDDGSVKTVTAQAETIGGLEPESQGGPRIEFDVEFLLADPNFYDDLTASASVALMAPVVGDVPTERILITLDEGETVTFPDGNFLTYVGDGTGSTAEFDLYEQTARQTSTSYFVNGLVQRNNMFPSWPSLKPGEVATGDGTIQYQPAYR